MAEPTEQPANAAIPEIPALTPLVYVDVAIGLNVGLFTSKVLFGNETSPGQAGPTITVVMPTGTMIQLAQSILQAFAQPHLSEKLVTMNKEFGATIDSMIQRNK